MDTSFSSPRNLSQQHFADFPVANNTNGKHPIILCTYSTYAGRSAETCCYIVLTTHIQYLPIVIHSLVRRTFCCRGASTTYLRTSYIINIVFLCTPHTVQSSQPGNQLSSIARCVIRSRMTASPCRSIDRSQHLMGCDHPKWVFVNCLSTTE